MAIYNPFKSPTGYTDKLGQPVSYAPQDPLSKAIAVKQEEQQRRRNRSSGGGSSSYSSSQAAAQAAAAEAEKKAAEETARKQAEAKLMEAVKAKEAQQQLLREAAIKKQTSTIPQESILVASTEPRSFISKVKDRALGIVKPIRETYQETKISFLPPQEKVFGNLNEANKKIDTFDSKLPAWARLNPVSRAVIKYEYGSLAGLYGDIREKPLKNVALAGSGVALGAAIKGASIGASYIPKAGRILSTGVKVGSLAGGTYLTAAYGYQVGKEIKSVKSTTERAAIFSTSAKDFALMSAGIGKGIKAAEQTQGVFRTLGRKELITEQGEYPQAPSREHLELFRANKISELSNKPGAFHTTSQKFWGDTIAPQEGTSELPGMYASTKVSTPFSKISGSSNNAKVSMRAVFEGLTTENKPAIAFDVPKGFREVSFGYSKSRQFEGQKYIKGKGFAYFKDEAIPGMMDIPKMKNEIEAIARPEAGEYRKISGGYYTKIKGVRVPIDVFEATGKLGKKGETRIGGRTEGYSSYSSSYTPGRGLYSVASISSSSYKVGSYSSRAGYSRSYSSSLYSSAGLSSALKSSTGSSKGKSTSSRTNLTGSSSGISTSIRKLSQSTRSYGGTTSISKTRFTNKTPSSYRASFNYKMPKGIFSVQVRRFGKFKTIGVFGSAKQAFSTGKSKVERSLAASFRVRGASVFGTPRGFYKKGTREGVLFIERRGRRLKRGSGEIPEIKSYRRRKRKDE